MLNSKSLLLLFLLIILMSVSCHFKSPEAPSWTSQFLIPLANKEYTLTELAENENIKSDSTGLLEYVTEHPVPEQVLGDRLGIGPFQLNHTLQIDNIHLPFQFGHWAEYSFSDIYPDAESEHGKNIVINPFEILPASQDFLSIPAFQWIMIQNGDLIVTIENMLDITLGRPFRVQIVNAENRSIIGEAVFQNEINAGHSAEYRIQLLDKLVPTHLAAVVSGISSGSNNQIIEVNKNRKFRISLSFDNVTVSGFQANVPEYPFSRKSYIELSDTVQVNEAIIKTGELELTLQNNFEIRTNIIIDIPNIITSTGEAFSDTLDMLPKQQLSLKINLEKYKLLALDQSLLNRIGVNWTVKLSAADNEPMTIRNVDGLQCDIRSSRIIFSSLTGKLNRLPVILPTIYKHLDLPSEVDSVKLAQASVTFNFTYNFKFYLNLAMRITAHNSSGDSASIFVNKAFPAVSAFESVHSVEFTLTEVATLFNIIPDQLKLEGVIYVGEKKLLSHITEYDGFSGNMKLFIPFQFILPSQHFKSQIRTANISNDMQTVIEDNILSGFIEVKTINNLPFSPAIKLRISDQIDSVFTDHALLVGPIQIGPVELDPSSGQVVDAIVNESEFQINRGDLKMFLNPHVFVGVEIKWAGSLGQYVSVYAQDNISVTAMGFINAKADFQGGN